MRSRQAFVLTAALLAAVGFLTVGRPHPSNARRYRDLPLLSSTTPARQGNYALHLARPVHKGEVIHFEMADPTPNKPRHVLLDLLPGRLRARWPLFQNDTKAEADSIIVGLSLPRTSAGFYFTAEVPGTGVVYPLSRWWGGSSSASTLQYAEVPIPLDYPDSANSLDVHLYDGNKPVATWRLTNLPHPWHAIAPPVTTRSTASVAKGLFRGEVTVMSQNWAPHSLWLCERVACVRPPAGLRRWRVESVSRVKEWDSPGGEPAPMRVAVLIDNAKPAFTPTRLLFGPGDHWVRGRYELWAYDEVEERATFTNIRLAGMPEWPECVVAADQTVTLASGLTVTLPRQHVPGAAPHHQRPAGLLVRFKDKASTADMPASPLRRLGKRTVEVTLSGTEGALHVASSTTAAASSGTGNAQNLHAVIVQNPGRVSGKVSRLTLVFRERVDLRRFPFELTMPVPTPGARAVNTPGSAGLRPSTATNH